MTIKKILSQAGRKTEYVNYFEILASKREKNSNSLTDF